MTWSGAFLIFEAGMFTHAAERHAAATKKIVIMIFGIPHLLITLIIIISEKGLIQSLRCSIKIKYNPTAITSSGN
jgi:hypothetical protein